MLTGGLSSRMGTPKAELRVEGEPLVDRVRVAMSPWCDLVIEVGPGFGHGESIADSRGGPLVALVEAWSELGDREAAKGLEIDEVLVCSVDLPRLTTDDLADLFTTELGGADACLPRIDGRAQPLIGRYSRRAMTIAADAVNRGHRSMRELLAEPVVVWLDVTGPARDDAFTDIDTPGQARRAGVETGGSADPD